MISAGLLTCTITGSVKGLFFVVNIDLIASEFKAFAPKPYTVSVGKATKSPLRNKYAEYYLKYWFTSDIQLFHLDDATLDFWWIEGFTYLVWVFCHEFFNPFRWIDEGNVLTVHEFI